jgi:hypothetical protein
MWSAAIRIEWAAATIAFWLEMSLRVGSSWPRRWLKSGTGAAPEEMHNTHDLSYGFTSLRTTPIENSVPVTPWVRSRYAISSALTSFIRFATGI